MKYLFIIIFLPFNLLAEIKALSEEELNPDNKEILVQKPEKFLRHESVIYDLNQDTGIRGERYYTGKDKNRLSANGHLSFNYEQPDSLLGIGFNYMRRSDRYDRIWWGFQYFWHKTIFNAITQNRTADSEENTEGFFQRPNGTQNTLMAAGLGLGYRFKLLTDALQADRVFETIDVFLNGVQLEESYIKETYQGYGLTTSYAIHKRSSQNFYYGGKFSYNLAQVTRAPIDNERRTDRTLILGWASLAFEMGIFY